jgi:hypothetical protein
MPVRAHETVFSFILDAAKPPEAPSNHRNNYYPEYYQNHVSSAYRKVFKHLSSQKTGSDQA